MRDEEWVKKLEDGKKRFTQGLLHPFERLWAVMNLDMAHPQKDLPSGSSVYTSVGFATLLWETYMARSTDSQQYSWLRMCVRLLRF